MSRQRSRLVLGAAAAVLLALLATFAIALANSQSKADNDVKQRFRERAQVSAALTQALFATISSESGPQNAKLYGGAHVSAAALSQVELRKMELARAMATGPKLLISDEAMAGLSTSEVDEVLDLLISLGGEDIAIIMIEHIMQAVMRFSERVMCLDAGRIIALGTPAEVMGNARVQEAYLGT